MKDTAMMDLDCAIKIILSRNSSPDTRPPGMPQAAGSWLGGLENTFVECPVIL
jgi:hypothetical protein